MKKEFVTFGKLTATLATEKAFRRLSDPDVYLQGLGNFLTLFQRSLRLEMLTLFLIVVTLRTHLHNASPKLPDQLINNS
jgi:hypothetical protein